MRKDATHKMNKSVRQTNICKDATIRRIKSEVHRYESALKDADWLDITSADFEDANLSLTEVYEMV